MTFSGNIRLEHVSTRNRKSSCWSLIVQYLCAITRIRSRYEDWSGRFNGSSTSLHCHSRKSGR